MEKDNNRDGMKKVLSYILPIISYVTIGFSLLLVAATFLLNFMGIKGYYVVSNSMVPVFEKGDLVLVSTKSNTIAVGDIVVYQQKNPMNRTVVHRVHSIEGNTITMKGDANSISDPPAEKSQIKGEVVGIGPNLGYVFNPYTLTSLSIIGLVSSLANNYIQYKSPRGKHHKED